MTAHVYGNSHIKALTGLRGVGALLVVFYHFHQAETGILQPLFEFFGSVGVMVFFALSGYILTSIYDKRFYSGVSAFSYFDFLCKRIARIYPLHFFLLIN